MRPTPEDLEWARDRTVPDIIAPDLSVLFCGINPGLYTAAVGHHFARPGNRFWKALYRSGFTDRLLDPNEERELLDAGYGITNLVERATARADELSAEEFHQGGKRLVQKLERYRPSYVAFVGIQAYRIAFDEPKAQPGLQERRLGPSHVWVLPSTSGLNAAYQPDRLTELFRELHEAAS